MRGRQRRARGGRHDLAVHPLREEGAAAGAGGSRREGGPALPPCSAQVTFKFGLGTDFINVLKTIKMLGLSSKEPIQARRRRRRREGAAGRLGPLPSAAGQGRHGHPSRRRRRRAPRPGEDRAPHARCAAGGGGCVPARVSRACASRAPGMTTSDDSDRPCRSRWGALETHIFFHRI